MTQEQMISGHNWPVLVFVDDRDMLRNAQTSLDDFVDHQSLQLRTALHQFPDTGGREFRPGVFLIAEAGQSRQDIRLRRIILKLQEDIDVFQILALLRYHFDVFHLVLCAYKGVTDSEPLNPGSD